MAAVAVPVEAARGGAQPGCSAARNLARICAINDAP
ncbi:putative oxidoreductase [Pseudomonas phage ZCPA1]|nr:putative oxidoreductase [Pseudomonas phage ZCPA1]